MPKQVLWNELYPLSITYMLKSQSPVSQNVIVLKGKVF